MNTEEVNDKMYTIAFYNLENLFDTVDNKLTNDNDFLPTSDKRWTKKRYERKLYKLGSAIAKIGADQTRTLPDIIGVSEVENKLVVTDLINSKALKNINYDIVHYNSPDERGIDVALIYNKDVFEVVSSETFSVYLEDENGERDYTRDILLVSGILNNETIYIIVNHWSSRREGEEASNYKRMAASNKVVQILSQIKNENYNPKFIVMGDFNDNPNNESIKLLKSSHDLYNPMDTLLSYDKGSLNYRFTWNLFDQILFSTNFFSTEENTLRFYKADIYDEKFLTQYKGKYKGQPFRTYVGKKYKGGFSDHFPVYIIVTSE